MQLRLHVPVLVGGRFRRPRSLHSLNTVGMRPAYPIYTHLYILLFVFLAASGGKYNFGGAGTPTAGTCRVMHRCCVL